VEDSLYIRDPNGVGLEFYREELGVFNGKPL
jgi:glyoxylase I family protein